MRIKSNFVIFLANEKSDWNRCQPENDRKWRWNLSGITDSNCLVSINPVLKVPKLGRRSPGARIQSLALLRANSVHKWSPAVKQWSPDPVGILWAPPSFPRYFSSSHPWSNVINQSDFVLSSHDFKKEASTRSVDERKRRQSSHSWVEKWCSCDFQGASARTTLVKLKLGEGMSPFPIPLSRIRVSSYTVVFLGSVPHLTVISSLGMSFGLSKGNYRVVIGAEWACILRLDDILFGIRNAPKKWPDIPTVCSRVDCKTVAF